MATYSSGAKRGGVVTELDRPWVRTSQTEPTGGRLPSAMRKNSNPEEVYNYMAPMIMGISMQGYVWVSYKLKLYTDKEGVCASSQHIRGYMSVERG